MATRDEQHDREARTKFNDQAHKSMQASQKAADGARKKADKAAVDLKARKENRRKRATGAKRRAD